MRKKATIQIYQEPRRLLTVKETAFRLGISEKTIYNAISHKSDLDFPIKCKRQGKKPLFDSRDIEAYIEKMPYEG